MSCDDFFALRDRFGDFALTNAIRLKPVDGSGSEFVPKEGYAIDDDAEGCVDDQKVFLIYIAVTKDRLFDLFEDLIRLSDAEEYDVVLESSHDDDEEFGIREHLREGAEISTLLSYLTSPDAEDVLLNDGSAGISVIPDIEPFRQVQLTEDKMLVVYTSDTTPFEDFLRRQGLNIIEPSEMVLNVPHIHHSSPELHEAFLQLAEEMDAEEQTP